MLLARTEGRGHCVLFGVDVPWCWCAVMHHNSVLRHSVVQGSTEDL